MGKETWAALKGLLVSTQKWLLLLPPDGAWVVGLAGPGERQDSVPCSLLSAWGCPHVRLRITEPLWQWPALPSVALLEGFCFALGPACVSVGCHLLAMGRTETGVFPGPGPLSKFLPEFD